MKKLAEFTFIQKDNYKKNIKYKIKHLQTDLDNI